ncbi:tetraprenyl-beta-curcumene synthase family protein [Gloeobacter kilaueensis]|uniref:Tetraprenyl-beta-curcumene synthase n=1 Tax=Gloeobacter kilaueensis (strain ATCC BAA-2537 / CCAP 1431/1 / ULC 316 / JS1) TaxID=1183438 RepID=U5QCK5_GLOK1|nr:tetraprenyl-beta-curcumene synthase family protein [Gloeobacter kilaueensis]AGY56652.1 hypothetical protein GKIL_0406 [Gloeobacter kilaueensis JS1]
MDIPDSPWAFLSQMHDKVLPLVRRCLNRWLLQARQIPNPELRKQALASLEAKQFHCEGGAIYGLLANRDWQEAVRFIVAYQTISDYLDNLCDRSNSLDPEDFRALHGSILHALTPSAELSNYYRFRRDQDDGNYLISLVKDCQIILSNTLNYSKVAPTLHELASYYCELQINKHVKLEERIPRLKAWFSLHHKQFPELSWYEFCACAGSTLGIFCLISYSFNQEFPETLTMQVKNSYFPWVQGLHILLDYLIDQEEDRMNNDLNFCFYYSSEDELTARLQQFVEEATKSVASLPHSQFHQLIPQALLGVYLSSEKVSKQGAVQKIATRLIPDGSPASFFFQQGLLASHSTQ